jgi:hypothetical protein
MVREETTVPSCEYPMFSYFVGQVAIAFLCLSNLLETLSLVGLVPMIPHVAFECVSVGASYLVVEPPPY